MLEHHTHYREIHGFDKTVWMTQSEHKKLHMRLRREGNCNIPSDKLNKISIAANSRTPKRLIQLSDYIKTNRQMLLFRETVSRNVVHREDIYYNRITGTVTISCGFAGHHGKKLFFIDVRDEE